LITGEGPALPGRQSPAADTAASAAPEPAPRVSEPGVADQGRDIGRPGKGKTRRRRKRRTPFIAGQKKTIPAPAAAAPAALVSHPAAHAGLYAALDLGTNNCRLLIATPRERGFRVVDAFSRIVRLGEGIGGSGRLSDAAMERAIEALAVCAAKLVQRDVARARLIATEACRLADNGEAFVERVARETGLRLEIVTRETEARLAVAGCASLVDPAASGVILFDIGGGSTELAWIDLRRQPGQPKRRMSDRIRNWASLPVGVVNLSERHGGEEVSRVQFEAMVDEVTSMLATFPDGALLDEAVASGQIHLLGTSGTVTTLAGVHLGLERYDRRQVDGIWMDEADVTAMIDRLVGTDYAGRVAHPCIGRERADLVLAGCAILEAVRRRWPCRRLRVADRGLREGILVELMAADGVWRRDRRRPAETRHPEPAHHG
jgi:exopolyphosphatase/guanosine-5'-triphosphate,3'-diphosphate pyrophosphatase